MLLQDNANSYLKEVEFLEKCQNINIIKFIDFFHESNLSCIITEYYKACLKT